MAVFVIWAYLFSPKPQPQAPTEAPTQAGPVKTAPKAPETGQAVARPEAIAPAAPARPSIPASFRDIVVRTDLYTAVFTESGGRLKSLTLNKYLTSLEPDSGPKELVVVDSPKHWPLEIFFQGGRGPDLRAAFFEADRKELNLTGPGRRAVLKMTFKGPQGLEAVREYTFASDSYLIELEVRLLNRSRASIDGNLILGLASQPFTNKERYAGFGAFIDDELLEVKPDDLEEDLEHLKKTNYRLSWAAYEDQYFLAGILPREQEKTRVRASRLDDKGVHIQLVNPPLIMGPNTQKAYHFKVFYGPKDYKQLKSLDNNLDRSIYFGWFDILSKPLLIFMTWLNEYVPNYGLVIIIVTILIKILFWPLTAKSYKSMKGMQKLQPKIMKLREKFKDDREAMNREMMQLYRSYKVNPLGGCLPMVIQIPVFIALYRLLDYSLELRHAPFCLWINDLSAPDRLFNFGFTIPLMEPPAGIPVLTLLMGASMLITQKMTPTPGDPTQAKIMMFMPIFFTFIFINFPAGLVLYWLVNNILSIGQQYYINKRPS